MEITFMHFIR